MGLKNEITWMQVVRQVPTGGLVSGKRSPIEGGEGITGWGGWRGRVTIEGGEGFIRGVAGGSEISFERAREEYEVGAAERSH